MSFLNDKLCKEILKLINLRFFLKKVKFNIKKINVKNLIINLKKCRFFIKVVDCFIIKKYILIKIIISNFLWLMNFFKKHIEDMIIFLLY